MSQFFLASLMNNCSLNTWVEGYSSKNKQNATWCSKYGEQTMHKNEIHTQMSNYSVPDDVSSIKVSTKNSNQN